MLFLSGLRECTPIYLVCAKRAAGSCPRNVHCAESLYYASDMASGPHDLTNTDCRSKRHFTFVFRHKPNVDSLSSSLFLVIIVVLLGPVHHQEQPLALL